MTDIDTAELGPVAPSDGWQDGHGQEAPLGGRRRGWQGRLWRALMTAPLMGLAVGGLLAVVLVGIGAAATLKGPTTWTSTTVMIIDDPYQLATAGDEGQLLKLDYLRYKYSALVDTDAIAQPVATKLDLPLGSVLSSVTAVVPTSALLMNVVATTSTSARASLLSQTMANQVTNYVQEEDAAYNIPNSDRFTITTIDPASTPVRRGPSAAHAAALALGLAVLGLLIGFCGAQLVFNRNLLT